jgi:hypothetical protein
VEWLASHNIGEYVLWQVTLPVPIPAHPPSSSMDPSERTQCSFLKRRVICQTVTSSHSFCPQSYTSGHGPQKRFNRSRLFREVRLLLAGSLLIFCTRKEGMLHNSGTEKFEILVENGSKLKIPTCWDCTWSKKKKERVNRIHFRMERHLVYVSGLFLYRALIYDLKEEGIMSKF